MNPDRRDHRPCPGDPCAHRISTATRRDSALHRRGRHARLAIVAIAACTPALHTPAPWSAAPPRAVAIPRSADGTLGLAEAIELAARSDPRVAAMAGRRHVAELKRSEVLLRAAPDVIAGAGYTTGFPGSGSHLQLRGMLGSPFFRHYVAGVDASWNAVELLRVPHGIRATEAEIEASDAATAVAKRDAALVVIDLFERSLGARATQDVLVAELGSRRATIDALRARVAAKSVAEAELLHAEAAIADLDAELAKARFEEHAARAALRVAIADDRALVAALIIEPVPPPSSLPERTIANASRRSADAHRTLAGLAWLPRLTLGASLGYANPPDGVDPGLYAGGVAIAFPITWGLRERNRNAIDATTADVRALEAEGSLRGLAIRAAELDGAIVGIEATVVAAAASRRAAELARTAIAARAQAGVVAQIELDAAEVTLRRAELRERVLRVHLAGMRARRSLLGTP